MENNFGLKTEDASSAQADNSASRNDESIVNVLAILSDGKTTMRGPSGTGFIVNYEKTDKCTVATSLHAVIPDSRAPLASIEVTGADGKKYPAQFARLDRPHDLALLTLEGVKNTDSACKPLPLADDLNNLKAGDSVTRFTRSRWGDSSQNVGSFSFSAKRDDIELVKLEGEDFNRSVMVFDLYNNRGVDLGGSPILNTDGKVIAIHGGGLDGKTSVATPVDSLQSLMRVDQKKL